MQTPMQTLGQNDTNAKSGSKRLRRKLQTETTPTQTLLDQNDTGASSGLKSKQVSIEMKILKEKASVNSL